jgi:hypothetical protein
MPPREQDLGQRKGNAMFCPIDCILSGIEHISHV